MRAPEFRDLIASGPMAHLSTTEVGRSASSGAGRIGLHRALLRRANRRSRPPEADHTVSHGASALPADPQPLRSTRKTAQLVLGLLLAQYALGIYVNLYTRIPIAHPGHSDHNFASASAHSLGWALTSQYAPFLLATHASIGLLLLVGAAELLRRAAHAADRALIRASLLGLIAIVGAGLSGVSFLDYNRDVYSYLMAMLFLLALLSNVAVLVLSGRTTRRTD